MAALADASAAKAPPPHGLASAKTFYETRKESGSIPASTTEDIERAISHTTGGR